MFQLGNRCSHSVGSIGFIVKKIMHCKRRVRIELNPPARTDDLPHYYAKVEPLLKRTSCLSLTSHPSDGISGFERSLNLIKYIKSNQPSSNLDILFHLTCRDVDRLSLKARLQELKDQNIKKVLIISGERYANSCKSEHQFENSSELLQELINKGDHSSFDSIAIAGFPGGNGTTSTNDDEEGIRLCYRLETGVVGSVYTQCIFELGVFEQFANAIKRDFGTQVELVPSIALFENLRNLDRVVQVIRVSNDVEKVRQQLSRFHEDDADAGDFSKKYLISLCQSLIDNGYEINMCLFGHIKLALEILDAIDK